MTCEIAVANRLGIALAADSALTFEKTDASGQHLTSYSVGANKILQPLLARPVALMFYNVATFLDLPWELIVKSFRSTHGHVERPQLQDYMSLFVQFLESAVDLFPEDVRVRGNEASYGVALLKIIRTLRDRQARAVDPAVAPADRSAECTTFATGLTADLDALDVFDHLDQADMDAALANDVPRLVPEAEALIAQHAPDLAGVVPVDVFLQLAVKVSFKWPHEIFEDGSGTGVVLAGYGEQDVIPSFIDREFFGFIGRRVYSKERSSRSVPRSGVGGLIEAFARKAMADSFTQGISPIAWSQASVEFKNAAAGLVNQCVAQCAGNALTPDQTKALVDGAETQFMRAWAVASINANLHPLLEVVAGLAMDQLAELGENLVMLESMKERVTHRTQSVSGPIDVAVITKTEGLVWLKRKHYFPAELNGRYFQRQQA